VTKALEPSADPLLDFERASAIRLVSPGFFEAEVPDGWQQGRGAFGGLVFGLLGRAMEMFNADATRTLRTLSGDIAGPVIPGPVRLETEMLPTNLRRAPLAPGSIRAQACAQALWIALAHSIATGYITRPC